MKILMNRKGTVPQAAYFMFYAIWISLLVLAFLVIVSRYQNMKIEVNQRLLEDIYMQRAWNSPNCFAYFDEKLQRTYAGIIDPEKFTSNMLEECYKICNAKPVPKEEGLFGDIIKEEKTEEGENCMYNFGFKFVLTNLETGKIMEAETENFKYQSVRYNEPVLIHAKEGLQRGSLDVLVQRTIKALVYESEHD